MSRTIRNVPKPSVKWNRTPKFKGKLIAGVPSKQVTTNYDDKPIAARKEMFNKD